MHDAGLPNHRDAAQWCDLYEGVGKQCIRDEFRAALTAALATPAPPAGLGCYDCGRLYEKGPDLVLSNEDWTKIAPQPPTAGVLCPNCMNDRFEALGVEPGSIPAKFTSGPFASPAGRGLSEAYAAGFAEARDKAKEWVMDGTYCRECGASFLGKDGHDCIRQSWDSLCTESIAANIMDMQPAAALSAIQPEQPAPVPSGEKPLSHDNSFSPVIGPMGIGP